MFPSLSLDIHTIPLFCVGISILLTGLYIFFQNPRSVIHGAFLLICLSLNFWFLGIPFVYTASEGRTALILYRSIVFFGITMIAPSVYFFTAAWLGILDRYRVRVLLSFLICLGFYLLGLTTPWGFSSIPYQTWGYYPKYGPSSLIFVGFFFVVLFDCIRLYLRAYLAETPGLRKTQVRLIALAFFISFLGSVDYLPKLTPVTVYPVGFLFVFVWIALVAYAIIRYRVMNIDTVIHKTVMWVISTVLVIVPFAGLLYTVQDWIFSGSPMRRTLGGLLAGIVFIFYFQTIQPRLDHLFQRGRVDLRKLLEHFSNELAQLKNLRDLLQRFCRVLRRSLYISQISVYLHNETNGMMVPVIAKRIRGLHSIPMEHPVLEWLEKMDEVVPVRLMLGHPDLEPYRKEVEEYLAVEQAVMIIPFVLGGRLIGVAHLGKKMNLRKYSHEEIHFLSQLRAPLAIAFSNSRQFENVNQLYLQVSRMSEELKKWNVELERRVEERSRELAKTQEQLIQAEKLATLGTLAGGVAHEINNPLTAVLTNAQILKMTASGEVKESLDLIEEGAKRCQGIVQKLMKYARKTAEETPFKPVGLNDVVKSTCALLNFQFQQENIAIEMKLGDLPPVPGISNELEQVLTNLLVNARDAVQAAKVKGKIVIETRKAGDVAELLVTDNGTGISPENAKKIFDPFFTTKDVGAGTGLGLAVSFGILKRHHATIAVDSKPGKGATFIVRFPLTSDRHSSPKS